MDVDTYQLSATLQMHEDKENDVRSVDELADGAIVTGSRDRTVRLWQPATTDEGIVYTCDSTLIGHTHYVQSVCTMPTGIASCSNDKHIIEWDVASSTPSRILEGHTDVVSCVTHSVATGMLYSASWDKTARVWKDGECVRVLKGHEAALWAVLPLDEFDGQTLTGSGDRTVKLWRGEACAHTFTGHTDVVRSLAYVSGVGFLSSSNDGTVRLWELGGSCLSVFQASESFVYSVSVLPSGEYLTCSEDRNLRIWSQQGDLVQSMTHPTTVWAAKALGNGDLVAGCADGNAYVWTKTSTRVAPPSVATLFKEAVAAFTLPAQQVKEGMLGDLDTDNLPNEEALLTPGQREGQTKIVKDSTSGTPFLYQWSVASGSWEKVGEVTNAKDDDSGATLGKKMFEGKEYDYVFDIDLNGAMLKLPFNRGDDPWRVAQEWIWKNDFDQGFLDAIANHIITNTPGNVPQAIGNVDPFTSGGAYRPGAPASSGGAGGGRGNVDPFTSGGAYVPGAPPPPGGGARPPREDPLSANRYRPGNVGATPVAASTVMLTFDACKHDAVLGKLMQFNAELPAGGPCAPLSAEQSATLAGLVEKLKQPNMFHSTTVTAAEVALFLGPGGLLSWPLPRLFPAADLFRLLVLHPAAAPHLSSESPPVLGRVLEVIAAAEASASAGDKPAGAAILMLLRAGANIASRPELRPLVAASASSLIDGLAAPIEAGPSQARLAAVTLMHNVCAILSAKDLPGEARLQMDGVPLQALSLISHALSSVGGLLEPAEDEALFRLLATLGTLLTGVDGSVQTAKDLELPTTLGALSLPATAASKTSACKAAVLKTLG